MKNWLLPTTIGFAILASGLAFNSLVAVFLGIGALIAAVHMRIDEIQNNFINKA